MTYTQEELAKIRFYADALSDNMVAAYWVNDKDYHVQCGTENFETIARLMGYNITKRDEEVIDDRQSA